MKSICLIDTSIFCNMLEVPGRAQSPEAVRTVLKERIQQGDTLLLPLATIYETGNHIAHCGDGTVRRRLAQRFSTAVGEAFAGTAPWTPTPIHGIEAMAEWLQDFPDEAARGLSLADLSIIKSFEEQCLKNPRRHVLIWSFDAHLSSYDRTP